MASATVEEVKLEGPEAAKLVAMIEKDPATHVAKMHVAVIAMTQQVLKLVENNARHSQTLKALVLALHKSGSINDQQFSAIADLVTATQTVDALSQLMRKEAKKIDNGEETEGDAT